MRILKWMRDEGYLQAKDLGGRRLEAAVSKSERFMMEFKVTASCLDMAASLFLR